VTAALVRRTFTVDDYHRMAEAGILTEDDRVELIEGEIVEMSPIGSRHAAAVTRLNPTVPGPQIPADVALGPA
jgi:Uma2 family endonuclease